MSIQKYTKANSLPEGYLQSLQITGEKTGLRNVKRFCQSPRRMGNESPPHLKKLKEEDPAGRDFTFQNSSP